MPRPGRHARQLIRLRVFKWLAHSGWRVCLLGAAWYVGACVVAIPIFAISEPAAVPYLVGAALVGFVWFQRELVTAATATFASRMGAWAEEWTAAELRPLSRRGAHVEHNISFAELDADHVAVGEWGITVIETKWTQYPLSATADDARCRDAVVQARRAARKIRLLLTGRGQLPSNLPVEPVVIIWGPGAPRMTHGWTRVLGTIVVEGRQAQKWIHTLGGTSIDSSAVDSVIWQLRDYQRIRNGNSAGSCQPHRRKSRVSSL